MIKFASLMLRALALTLAFIAPALAQDKWPTKPVTLIVPFAAGGNTDTLARVYADRLSVRLGQQVIIDNRAGAGGITGVAHAMKSAPDGYTLAIATASGVAYNPVILGDKMPYNIEKDVIHLYNMANQPNLLVVHPSVPAKTIPELVAWLKQQGEIAYGTAGSGSSQHLCGELLAQVAEVKLTPVAYRASNQMIQDMIGGQVKLSCDNFLTAWEQVKAGNLRAIAISSLKPYAMAPEVPTLSSVYPGFDIIAMFGWVAPAGVPKPIVDRLISELVAVGKEPDVLKRLEQLGVEPSALAGEDYAAFTRAQRKAIAPVIEKAGIKAP